MDKLAKKPNKVKQPKLLSSKSLSQLVPRGLFFKKSGDPQTNVDGVKVTAHNGNNLATTKSFPINSTYRSAASLESSRQEQFLNRIDSDSMIGLPRQSSSNSFRGTNNCTLEQPNLSLIVIGQSPIEHVGENVDESLNMSWTEIGPNAGEQANQKDLAGQQDMDVIKDDQTGGLQTKRKVDGGKFKPFKGTTIVLRDVKNSLGLRMKAKHGCQAFSRLTNELATPPTKLYSPFNIYTPDSCCKDTASADNCKAANDAAAVKGRIAFRHKKHLMQANRFTFDSPTGRLRETIKDVEQFQQCIEDISKAIRARESK